MRYRSLHLLVLFVLMGTHALATGVSATPASLDLLLPAPQFPDCIGINTHILPSAPGEYKMFTDTGAKLARHDLVWADIEKTKGKYDFALVDQLVSKFARSHIRTLLIISGNHRFYAGEQVTALPTNSASLAGFADFATAAAKRYKGKPVIFELSNEPDGNILPQDYVAWAKTAAAGLRKGDPNAAIVGPGAHSWALPWLEEVFKLGLLDVVDGLSVHLYLGGDAGKPQPIPEMQEKQNRVRLLQDLVDKYSKGRDVPMINSEWGYCRTHVENPPNFQVTVENQARYLAREYLLSASWGFRANVWYCWFLFQSSEAIAGEFGLITGSRMPMPAYYALRNLAKQLPKGKFITRHDLGSPDDYCLEFQTSKGKVLAVWTSAPVEYEGGHEEGHAASIPVGDFTQAHVTDLLGSSYYDLKAENKAIPIKLTGAVKYLRLSTK